MIDFLMIATRMTKTGVKEIYPKFIVKKSHDLMIRGGDFYAIWMEDRGFWSTDEDDAINTIDAELTKHKKENYSEDDPGVRVLHMWDSETGLIDKWHKYCQQQMRDNFHMLDENIIFSNVDVRKEDYASRKLSYPLEAGSIDAYDRLMSVLYSPEERHKIEWAIGSIVSGDSKKIQKFLVLYGAAGTGKSTVLNIIEQLFEGYLATFDAKALGSANAAFALEPFKTNPLVAIQHDGDLSRIEDNTRLNSLVSHELMTVNEKHKSLYSTRFKAFLFLGTNRPVKITDAKSGLIRRLIDVSPTGEKLGIREYRQLTKQIGFELGAIADHCLKVYEADPGHYDNYIPIAMMGASNDFYNFVEDSYGVFKRDDGVTLKAAWEMYKTYCDEAKVGYPYSRRLFKEEMRNYFKEYYDRFQLEDGTRVRNYYSEFRFDKFEGVVKNEPAPPQIIFSKQESEFDKLYADCPAQYANEEGNPERAWKNVTTKLRDLDTSRLHWVLLPEDAVFIDFDIPGADGEKNFEKNLEEASKWPKTYAETSKSDAGIHLHYIYKGDVSALASHYAPHIEVKVRTGNSALRRKLTRCNAEPIAVISSGLPLKTKGEKVVNFDSVKSEKGLRKLIVRNLNKEIHPGTKPSIDFIFKILEDAYKSGLKYDVSDMRQGVISFAAQSTHQADYCLKLVNKMRFSSDENSQGDELPETDEKLIFFDIEVFPNLFLVCWKVEGEGKTVVRMINPSPAEIEELLKFRLVGFNCRRYDNHLLYARLMGYDNEKLYKLSQRIIVKKDKDAFFGEAYNISYTDIYDFASAGNKKGLKKLEIEMGIHHQELGFPWDQPVPEEMWDKVAEYCCNDVIATEAAFNYLKGDWTARQILADLAGMTVNDTTNSLTTRIIFGENRKPQDQFWYRDMGDMSDLDPGFFSYCFWNEATDDYFNWDSQGRPLFKDYIFENGKSVYRDEEVGEGGYVYAEPGIHTNVALLDIASMHPSSIIAENLFGDEYTRRYKELKDARVYIKHEDWDTVGKILGGKLAPYVEKIKNGEITSKDLSNALKTSLNSVYGLTSASFDNPFRDRRNKDNIVAKRGALFMVNLKHEVQRRGFTVAHIKTDSIKIPNATPEIISFVMDYGKLYGYEFEHEATYDRMCLVNDAVYIAKYKNGDWTATGTQFAVPYVFKTLFSCEPLIFEDFCETKSVKEGAIYLDMNEELPDVSAAEKRLKDLESKYRKGELSDTTFEREAGPLAEEVATGHNYIFVGGVGQFCPVKAGCGGGLLERGKDGRYYAVTGTKGYRWMESEMVKTLGLEANVDESYYISLADAARAAIEEFGSFEKFVSGEIEPVDDFMNVPEGEDELLPFV